MLKIESDNIYLRMLAQSDMPIIATAMTGVFASDALPTDTDQKYFFYKANVQNNTFPTTETVLGDTKIGHLNLAICLKSDDSPIGFCITRYVGKSIEQKMTAIIPAQRDKKFYTESTIARHRFYYDTLKAEDSTAIIPTSNTGTNTSVRQTLDSLYQTNEKVYTIEQREYRKAKITKDEWTTWLNSSSSAGS